MSEWAGALCAEDYAGAPAAPRAELIVCTSCGEAGAAEPCAGEQLLAALRRALAAQPPGSGPPLALASIRCLWACARGCAVQLRSPGRMGYALADFGADEVAVRALLAFAGLYCASPDGVVLAPQWPAGLRGHFLCRVPAAEARAEREPG